MTFSLPPVRADGPPAMTKEAYYRWLQDRWPPLLDGCTEEVELQKFLERHPCLVPGFAGARFNSHRSLRFDDTEKGHFHHGVFKSALFSQPRLSAPNGAIPDFMWVAAHSAEICAVLIEIERPNIKFFNKSGDPSSKFSHALMQIAAWKAWFREPRSRETFADLFGINELRLRARNFSQQYVLIMGRRREFEGPEGEKRLKHRHALAPEGVEIMSWDRLSPSFDAMDYITVTASDGLLKAVALSPTYRVGPSFNHGEVTGLVEALDNSDIDEDRKGFLRERLPVWQDFAQRCDREPRLRLNAILHYDGASGE